MNRNFSLLQNFDKSNFYNHALIDVPEDWTNYDAIICNPIHVNRVKKINEDGPLTIIDHLSGPLIIQNGGRIVNKFVNKQDVRKQTECSQTSS